MRRLMVCWVAMLALPAVEPGPAPATTTASESTGSNAGERATTAAIAAEDAWLRARTKARNDQRLQQAQATRDSTVADRTRTPHGNDELDPGGLASLIDGNELALLLELQRRRRNANDASDTAADDLLTRELTTILLTSPPRLSTPFPLAVTTDATEHPSQAPHPGPVPPTVTSSPQRPEELPTR